MAKNSIQNSGEIPTHQSIIYNFKVQMPSLNQVTAKCRIWINSNYYIMVTFLPEYKLCARYL